MKFSLRYPGCIAHDGFVCGYQLHAVQSQFNYTAILKDSRRFFF